MGQKHTVDSEIPQINAITSYFLRRSPLFLRTNGLSLTFKAIHERSKWFAYLRGGQVMIKVKVAFGSQGGDNKGNKWFLTEGEFAKVCGLIYEADGMQRPVGSYEVPESRLCPICQECPLEQRFPGCNVRFRQHGYCSRCITDWLGRDETCPLCRLPAQGATADLRRTHLMTSVNLSSDVRVRQAIAIICHRE